VSKFRLIEFESH